MSFLCYLGRHKPSLQSVHFRKEGGHAALCESCSVPIEREGKGAWRTRPAIVDRGALLVDPYHDGADR